MKKRKMTSYPVILPPPGPIPKEIKEKIRTAKALYNNRKFSEAYAIEDEVKEAGYSMYLIFSEKDDPIIFSLEEDEED